MAMISGRRSASSRAGRRAMASAHDGMIPVILALSGQLLAAVGSGCDPNRDRLSMVQCGQDIMQVRQFAKASEGIRAVLTISDG